MIEPSYIPDDNESLDALSRMAQGDRGSKIDIVLNHEMDEIFERVYDAGEVLESDEYALTSELDSLRVDAQIMQDNDGEFPDDDEEDIPDVIEQDVEEETEEIEEEPSPDVDNLDKSADS